MILKTNHRTRDDILLLVSSIFEGLTEYAPKIYLRGIRIFFSHSILQELTKHRVLGLTHKEIDLFYM